MIVLKLSDDEVKTIASIISLALPEAKSDVDALAKRIANALVRLQPEEWNSQVIPSDRQWVNFAYPVISEILLQEIEG